jgi:hypothetical protein
LPAPAGDGFAFGALLSSAADISLRPYTFIDLAVGSSYRFAVQGLKVTSSGLGSIANAYCEVHVQIVNRNGTTSPLDPAQEPRPPAR